MKIKCLLSLDNDNHVIYLNGNSIQHLIQSIQCKSELFNKIRNLGDNVLFEVSPFIALLFFFFIF